MKKLLSLLSVLTISGTAVPTTIAARLYQKEEKLNRNKIENNKQNNNLENFNTKTRIKRAVHKYNKIEISENKDFIKQNNNIINESTNSNLNWTGEIWLNFNNKDMEFTSQYYFDKDGLCYYMIDINVEKMNPGDYNRIFFGGYEGIISKNQLTYATWGNTRLSGTNINDVLQGRDLKEIMPRIKVENNDNDISSFLPISLQYVKYYNEGLAYVSVYQKFRLTYYYDSKEKSYHIQVLIGKYAGAVSSFSGGIFHLGIGAYLELGKI